MHGPGGDAGRRSVGGIVGRLSGYISNCYNNGKISVGSYYPYVGGIVGAGICDINSCYSTTVNKNYPHDRYSGDIIGYNESISGREGLILTYCYCPDVLVGPKFSNQYNGYTNVSSEILSEAEMREKSSYVGFDFETIWDINANTNGGYPILRHVGNLSGDIPDPDPNPNDEITFSVDIGKTFTINVGDQLAIKATFSPIEGMTENSVMWFTDNPEVADIDHVGAGSIGPEITSSIGWINGIAPGTANISVALPDGRTGSVEVTVKEKDGSNVPLKDFNVSVYRADLLANRTDTPSSRTLFDLLGTRSPSRIFQEELQSDWGLLDAVNAWNAICNTFDTVDNPYNLHDLAFEEKDFYMAILMDILETNVSHSQVNSMESFVKTSKGIIKEATAFVKLKFDISEYDNPFASEEDRKNIADAYMEYFQTELKFDTWDTKHIVLGYMNKIFEHYDTIMDAVGSLEDFTDRIISAFALVAMSDSTKNVVRELYANCPTSNQPLRAALSDIIRIMDSSEDQLIAELVSNTLTVVGENACSKLVGKFWDKAILSCVPEVKILISSYKAGKWVSDKLFGTSKIAEECNKVIMTTVFETLMVSTVQKLGGKFSSAQDISSADTFLKSVDIYFSVLDHSADQAVSFVDSVDSGWFPKIWNFFNPGGNESKDDLKKSIESIRATYSVLQNSLWNGWIFSLEGDYPDSGLYEKYSSELVIAAAKEKRERKKVQVHCPVDVLLYDSSNNLVAYVRDGKVHCDDGVDLTLVVRGDEKTILFYDDADYRMECVGTDTGSMDVIITEYSTAGEQIRDVYFYDLPLRDGTIYETDVDDQTLNGITYQLTSPDGDIFSADLDTYNTLEEKYTLNIVSGAADIDGEDVFTAEFFAGQQINIMAYTPKNCKFTGWTSNIAGTVFDDATQEATVLTMPASDVVIRATIAETGYSVIFDANGGTCDTVVIATDLGMV